MGKENSKVGVGATISIKAKTLGKKWAQTRFPHTWKEEVIKDIVVTGCEPSTTPGKSHHTLVFELTGKVWRIDSTKVRVLLPAPEAAQVGNQAPVPLAPVPSATSTIPDDPVDDAEPDEESPPEPSRNFFSINIDSEFSVVDIDSRSNPKTSAALHLPHVASMNGFQLWKSFLPMTYFEDVLVPATNANAAAKNLVSWKPLLIGEFMSFLAIWLAMSFVALPNRRDYWLKTSSDWLLPPLDMEAASGISARRFESILAALRLTPCPNLTDDPFWEVRPLIQSYNQRLTIVFEPSWSSCLDESMVQYDDPSCPGWIIVTRKFTDKGNEYHAIADTRTKIVYQIELVEGKDRPLSQGLPEFEEQHGKTPALLLRMTKAAKLWGTGKAIFLDSAFCVLEGLVALRERGVHAFAVIKKRRYWPRHVPGDEMLSTAALWDIGKCQALRGLATTPSGTTISFFLSALRDNQHVFLAMSTHGTLHPTGKLVRRGTASFHRPSLYDEYYISRHSVDDSNNIRQGHRGIEATWETRSWAHRQLAYLVALAEANAWSAKKYFAESRDVPDHLTFRKRLVDEAFVEFKTVPVVQTRSVAETKKRKAVGHDLLRIPEQGKFADGQWVPCTEVQSKYRQWRCCGADCDRKTSFYCSCSPMKGICRICFGIHFSQEVLN
jgi:hypothetical protein